MTMRVQQLSLLSERLKPIIEGEWDFNGADTTYLTHGIHPYPARMIPQIANRLITRYSNDGNLIFDPFCGSGTVLCESVLNNRDAVGIDLNPLARLIARVKTTAIPPKELGDLVNKTIELVKSPDRPNRLRDSIQIGVDVGFWFKPKVARDLQFVSSVLESFSDHAQFHDLLKVAFSVTVREVSNTRNGEFKLYRIPEEKLKNHDPDAKDVFLRHLHAISKRCADFHEHMRGISAKAQVFESDARVFGLDESADLIVTSPPYGDSRTTVAYGQFSRLASEWLGFKEAGSLDRRSLGGMTNSRKIPELKTLQETLARVESKDKERVKDVSNFFVDMYCCMERMHSSLRTGGKAAIVIGDRTVKGFRIPNGDIIIEMGKDVGFSLASRFNRKIPSKTMPSKNSPSNVTGETGSTILGEHIIVLEK